MAFIARVTLLILTSTVIAGCSENDLILKRQAETEAKVERLIQDGQKNLQQFNIQAGEIVTLSEQLKSVTAQLAINDEIIRSLRKNQDDLIAKTTLIEKQFSTPKVEMVNPNIAALSKGSDPGPPPEYVKAFGLYSTNSFRAAIEAFEDFLKKMPDNDFAPNALYWIGECHYTLSALPAALASFRKVTEKYPKSPKVPDALLKQGYTLMAMKEKSKAKEVFEEIARKYPNSPAAVKAREKLSQR